MSITLCFFAEFFFLLVFFQFGKTGHWLIGFEGPGGGGGGGGGGPRVHHGRVGSAGLCDLKILHPWQRLKKGVKILQ